MCGRYFFAPDGEGQEARKIVAEINERYKDGPFLSLMKIGEIFPTNVVPVLTVRSAELMKWGFTRVGDKGVVINARAETLTEKPMFRNHYFSHRCLIPANHYFEWEKTGGKKIRYAIGLSNLFFMAGLYRHEKQTPLSTFVIITGPAAPELAFIHDRMPILVSSDNTREWLYNSNLINEEHSHPVLSLSYWKA